MAIFRGMSADAEFEGYGDCCGVRLDLLIGGGLPMLLDAELGAATGDELEFEVGVWASRSDFGAGGPRYDLRLCCSIMLTAHSSRLTGVRLAACKKASLS